MKYYLIAGEASGDKHGAALMKAILTKDKEASFRFWGGDEMEDTAGQKAVTHVRNMAFMGFIEVIKNITTILHFFKLAKKDISAFQPDIVVFIDYPGFNLRMAKWAKTNGYTVIYYISPSVWAWHKSRIRDIKKYVDLMICILPFEEDFYRPYGVRARYFGNPIADAIHHFVPDNNFLGRYGITKPILALLPGSRLQEIDRILPIMVKATTTFAEKYQIVIAQSNTLSKEHYFSIIEQFGNKNILLLPNEYYNLLAHANLAVVTSGTATFETALFRVPQLVCYITSPLTYFLAKRLVKLKYISLVNLIPDEGLVKELIQEECTEVNIRMQLQHLIDLDAREKNQFYAALFQKLGDNGSADRIAQAIIDEIKPTANG